MVGDLFHPGDVALLRAARVDFDRAVAFDRDPLGLRQLADWSSEDGAGGPARSRTRDVGVFDHAQAAHIDQVEVRSRVSGPVRLCVQVPDSDTAAAISSRAVPKGVAPAVDTRGETARPGLAVPTLRTALAKTAVSARQRGWSDVDLEFLARGE